MRHNPGYGIMRKLMERSPMPVDGLEIGLWSRHVYEIMDGAVERALSANPEFYAGRADQRLGVRQDQPFGNRCRGARQFVRFSHWSVLKTVKRFRNGIAYGSSPSCSARRRSSSGVKRSA
jgi:hypothetical protein